MSPKQHTVLRVGGMTCPSCIRHVEGALLDLEGVHAVEVRLREGRVVVAHDGEPSVVAMVEALRHAGYDSAPVAD